MIYIIIICVLCVYFTGRNAKENEIMKDNKKLENKYEKIDNSISDVSDKLQNGKY
ncbi:MAG: hypothetical protein Ta2D_04600 [Rickettsiales bacterium]|nr:MAG: hypothetical protein Ta2D_04600 [Rickettsiales bacterium]